PIMSEDNVLQSRPHRLEEVDRPQSVQARRRAPNVKSSNQEVEARAPVRQEDPGEWIEWPAQPEEEQPQATTKKSRTSLLKRRPSVAAMGVVLPPAARGGGSFFRASAGRSHPPSDPFPAPRRPAPPPRVPGSTPAVPVTDNEHAAAGDVVARIDDRDY